jgi:hypothetical protein
MKTANLKQLSYRIGGNRGKKKETKEKAGKKEQQHLRLSREE